MADAPRAASGGDPTRPLATSDITRAWRIVAGAGYLSAVCAAAVLVWLSPLAS